MHVTHAALVTFTHFPSQPYAVLELMSNSGINTLALSPFSLQQMKLLLGRALASLPGATTTLLLLLLLRDS